MLANRRQPLSWVFLDILIELGHAYLEKEHMLCIPRARYLVQTGGVSRSRGSRRWLLRVGEKMVRSWIGGRDSPGQGHDMRLFSVPSTPAHWGRGLWTWGGSLLSSVISSLGFFLKVISTLLNLNRRQAFSEWQLLLQNALSYHWRDIGLGMS